MTERMALWNNVKQPPPSVLKPISAGRLKGKTDISPQWRYQVLTEEFGPCGIGWYYEIDGTWSEEGADGQMFAFANVKLYIKKDGEWSAPICGTGGSMLVTKEKAGLHSSDEGYKMAVTDALSVAMKMLGVAADIYLGRFDGSKYKEDSNSGTEFISKKQADHLSTMLRETGADIDAFLTFAKSDTVDTIARRQYPILIAKLEAKQKAQMLKDATREPGGDDE